MADFIAAPGAKKFVRLEDTPDSFSGQAGKYTKVGALEEDLEFATVDAGIAEGDYTSWTHKWTNAVEGGLSDLKHIGASIDDLNDLLYLSWWDSGGFYRFKIYNLEDFSVYADPAPGATYLCFGSYYNDLLMIFLGFSNLDDGGLSRSLQTYMLLLREDNETVEVWRAATSALWSHNTEVAVLATSVEAGLISNTGKWVLLYTASRDLLLYEGS